MPNTETTKVIVIRPKKQAVFDRLAKLQGRFELPQSEIARRALEKGLEVVEREGVSALFSEEKEA
jgi:hypothetical protein